MPLARPHTANSPAAIRDFNWNTVKLHFCSVSEI